MGFSVAILCPSWAAKWSGFFQGLHLWSTMPLDIWKYIDHFASVLPCLLAYFKYFDVGVFSSGERGTLASFCIGVLSPPLILVYAEVIYACVSEGALYPCTSGRAASAHELVERYRHVSIRIHLSLPTKDQRVPPYQSPRRNSDSNAMECAYVKRCKVEGFFIQHAYLLVEKK